jgi:hypothetical protein
MVEVSPHLSLAFALHSSPGTYALLQGAGVSLPSGVPGAWQVLHWLIGDLATAAGHERPDDPESWWTQTYGGPPTYDGVLEALTNSAEERRHLLAQFFEPTPQEREQGKKQPTTAHHAIAQLVQLGAVRVILTTNFDLLTETALRRVGIEPVVLSSPGAIAGMAPLHAQQCAVVHLHGDYNSPGVLNTQDELGAYDPMVDALLDQVFGEYGLVVVGWSAEWDVALRAALERAPARRFATYWVEPGPPREHARRLIATRDAVLVPATADVFLGQVADSVESMKTVMGRRDPVDVRIAVATAKRQLAGAYVAIDMHDKLRTEVERVASSEPVRTSDFSAKSSDEHRRRLRQLEVDTEMLLALVATAAYWGDESTDGWWFDDIARFGARPIASGSTALINLVQLPATAILYTAGIAAVGARRHDLLVRLLTEPTTTNNQGERVPVATHLTPDMVRGLPRSHRWLHLLLQPMFESDLGLGDAAFRDASERFEYLRLVQSTFEVIKRRGLLLQGQALEREIQEIEQDLGPHVEEDILGFPSSIERDPVLDEPKRKQLSHLRETHSQLFEQMFGFVRLGVPHMTTIDDRDGYTSVPAQTLGEEINRQREDHPLVRAGLCDRDVDALKRAMSAVNVAFNAFANDAAWSAVPPQGGILPSSPFYADEIGKWREGGQ